MAVHRVVMTAILEVVFEPPADLEATLIADRDIAKVEQAMNVGPEQKAVRDVVRAAVCVRPDMGGIQDRQGPLAGDRAAALVYIRHRDAECPLAKPRANQCRLAVSDLCFGE